MASNAECKMSGSLGADGLGPYKLLCLRNRQGCSAHAKVDPDYEHPNIKRWHMCAGYASAMPKRGGRVTLHREVADQSGCSTMVDHINGDKLDNRRANLRVASFSQNSANRLIRTTTRNPYKGVSFNGRSSKWRIAVGGFDTSEAAAKARDRLVRELFGAFAVYNFPEIGERSALTGGIRRGK